MAEVGNGSLSARKRRDMNGADNQSPVKKMKFDDEDPPEANPNAIEAVRHRNKEMALDLLEKNRRISFLTQKCESLFRQSAVSQRAFRCIQRQWVQLIDDVTSASDVLSLETPDEWRDVVAKTESLGVLRLPTSVVTVALPQWFLAISRGDKEVELKDAEDEQEDDDDDDGPEEATEPLDEKEQLVQKSLQEEQQRVKDVVQKLLAAVSNGSTKPLEFKELIAQKREATAQALRYKDDLEAVKRKLTDVETDLEAKEVERHQACRAYDRLKEYIEKLEKEAPKTSEAADSVKVENGADQARTKNDAKSSKRAGDKHVTLVDPDVKPSSADREVLRQLNADKVILLQKLKEERQHVESMRSELNRLRAVESASKQEEMRLKQEFEATVARLQDEKANAADALAASHLQQTELLSQTQEKWKSQLDKIQEDTIKTKAKFNDLVLKNTALREKLASFSAYRDQLSDLKSLHEALKREAERLQGDLKRAHARREREDKVEETKQIIELRENLAVVTKERDELKEKVTELTASLEKSGNAKLAETLRRETQVLKTLEDVRAELATSRADVEKARAELATAHANHDAFKDENDALVAEIDVLGKEVESARHSKKKVLKQLDEKRQSAKKMQSELAKESGARAHATEELATVRLQVSSLKYVHMQQKAALEAAKESQKATDQELAALKKALEITQTERDALATEKAKADRDAEVAKQMFKAEATHKQRQVLQDKSRPCDKCESYRKKEADLEKRLAALRASASSSGGDANNSGLTDLERFELQDLRKQLKCSVCQDRHKDVIISKCSHLFCKECIDSNLRSRNRKCPTCKKMYGQDDVKSVWFT